MSLPARTHALETLFTRIQHGRMAGLALLNPALRVQAVGMHAAPDGWGQGILITPWFMNLVRFAPIAQHPAQGVGQATRRSLGAQALDFTGAYDADFGRYESCALVSPMHAFASQPQAVQMAQEILQLLRGAPAPAPAVAAQPPVAQAALAQPSLEAAAAPSVAAAAPADQARAAQPSRRALLLGRRTA